MSGRRGGGGGGGRRGRGSMAPTQQAPQGRGRCELEHGLTLQTQQPSVACASQPKPETKTAVVQQQKPAASSKAVKFEPRPGLGRGKNWSRLSFELEHGFTLQTQQQSVARASKPKPETKTTVVQQQKPAASSKAVKFAPTPGYGTASTRCMIRANHFLVELSDRHLHHYDISIAPEVTSRGLKRVVMRELLDKEGKTQFDGRKPAYDFYTAGALPFTSKDFVVRLIDKDENGSAILSSLSYLEEHEEDQVQMDQKCIVCQSRPCICSKEQLHSKDSGAVPS